MTSMRVLALAASIALGCARDLRAPQSEGRACDSDAECNRLPDGGAERCGRLRLCIAGRCEADTDGGSVLVVCGRD